MAEPPRDAFKQFEYYWYTTEWEDLKIDKIRSYLKNYSKIPIPPDVKNESIGKRYFEAVRKELCPDIDVIINTNEQSIKIWKIGAWPGVWHDNTLETKERYIREYALPKNFVALGYGWIPNIKKTSTDVIKKLLADEGRVKLGRLTDELKDFARVIDIGHVILLYNYRKVYVGIVKNPYYYVEKGSALDFIKGAIGDNIAPHRIDVEWQFNKASFDADFSHWYDTVHQVLEKDLVHISDIQLRKFLKQKLMES